MRKAEFNSLLEQYSELYTVFVKITPNDCDICAVWELYDVYDYLNDASDDFLSNENLGAFLDVAVYYHFKRII